MVTARRVGCPPRGDGEVGGAGAVAAGDAAGLTVHDFVTVHYYVNTLYITFCCFPPNINTVQYITVHYLLCIIT